MPDYEPPERSVSGRDVVFAWVLMTVKPVMPLRLG